MRTIPVSFVFAITVSCFHFVSTIHGFVSDPLNRVASRSSSVKERRRYPTESTRLVAPRLPLNYKLLSSKSDDAATDELSEERKANLFQFLLRDLQVEGVPLLAVDADQVHTLQAALWTTLAELSEQGEDNKACLIFEDIPIPALRTLVDDFMILKTQERLMRHLPELERLTLSLVGKGVGPAILVDVAKREGLVSSEIASVDENASAAAMKMFIDRVMAGLEVCPFVDNPQMAPSRVDAVPPAPIAYRNCNFGEPCHVLSSFWNCVCELLVSPREQVGTMELMLPAIVSHERFAAMAELLSRSLCLYRGDDVLELLHFHPRYNRASIHPRDQPAHGHLPPVGWWRSILRHVGVNDEFDEVSDEELEQLANYQRCSPVTAVCIKRVADIEAAMRADDGTVDLTLEDGSTVKASGLGTYARNLQRLSREGTDTLQATLDNEIAMVQ